MNDKKTKNRSFGFSQAWNGLKAAVRMERNIRVHLITGFGVILGGVFFRLTIVKWFMILFAIGLVLVTEMLNTAIEKMLDYLKPDINPQAKVIKDLAAGAVFISAILAIIIGLLVFLPEFYALI